MINLIDKETSYMIVSPGDESNSDIDNKFLNNKICNILYSKDYTLYPITEYHNGYYQKSFIATNNSNDNNKLRADSIYLIEEFNKNYIIVKYKNENIAKKILNDGSEKILSLSIYDSDPNNKVYLCEGVSFSFIEEKRYQILTNKDQLKNGMVIEFFNNDKWIKKEISDINIEYEKLYKLLIKYQKLRVCID